MNTTMRTTTVQTKKTNPDEGVIVVEADDEGVPPEPCAEAGKVRRLVRRIRARLALVVTGEAGMSTVEYAIGTIAAAAFGAVLYQVVTGDSIVSALTGIIDDALNTSV